MTLENKTKTILPDLRYLADHDVKMRLQDTVLTYNGRLVFCQGIEPILGRPPLDVRLLDIESGEAFVAHSSDEDLDISSIPLGWITLRGNPLFVTRGTRTSQKQGLFLPHLYVFDPIAQDTYRGIGWDGLSELMCLVDLQKRVSHPIHEVTGRSKGGVINPDWALIRSGRPKAGSFSKFFTIYHRNISVGTYDSEGKEFFFRRGRLTKTRRADLREIFFNSNQYGVNYAITEQA